MDIGTKLADGGRHAGSPAPGTDSPERLAEHTQRAYARFAGFMYLFVLAFDISGLIVTSSISGSGSFLATSHRIVEWEPLYRIGLLLGLVGSLSTILLAVGLYVALKPVDANLAMTALLFRVVESAAGVVGAVMGFGALQVNLATNHASAFDTNQLGALADLNSGPGAYVDAIVFCVGSTIFFYLFLKSAYIPRLLAAWGVFASVLYMTAFVGALIVPHYAGIFIGVGSVPILIAEVSTALWLLMRGIKTNVDRELESLARPAI